MNYPTVTEDLVEIEDDCVVFVPTEEIKAINNIYFKLMQVKQEFCKMTEELYGNM